MRKDPAAERDRGRMPRIAPAVLLPVVAGLVFLYTVKIRGPWFGDLSAYHHQWLTGSTVKFEKNWYREGAWNLRFTLLENPRSAEFPTFSSREPYASYPPGTLLPLHLLCLLLGREPTPALIMGYNLAHHLLVAITLPLLVYAILLRVGLAPLQAGGMSLIPVFLTLLLPGPLYFHQNVFWGDQAIIPVVALFILLEIIRGTAERVVARNVIGASHAVLLFYGALTDWFMYVVALTVFVKRLVLSELGRGLRPITRNSALYWSPVALATALFLVQVHSIGWFQTLVFKFLARAAMIPAGAQHVTDFSAQFWKGHFVSNYGEAGLFLIRLSLVAFLLGLVLAVARRLRGTPAGDRTKTVLSAIWMILVPCFVHTYLLRSHSVNHDFTTLKFVLPIATIPFVLLPLLLATLAGKESRFYSMARPPATDPVKPGSKKKGAVKARPEKKQVPLAPWVTVFVTFALAGAYLAKEHPRYRQMFPPPEPIFAALGDFLSENTGFGDVVFSPYFEIPTNPPQLLSYTMKRVYKAGGITEIHDRMKNVTGDYTVDLFFFGERTSSGLVLGIGPGNGWKELIAAASDVRRNEAIRIYNSSVLLYRIRKEDFLEACRRFPR